MLLISFVDGLCGPSCSYRDGSELGQVGYVHVRVSESARTRKELPNVRLVRDVADAWEIPATNQGVFKNHD